MDDINIIFRYDFAARCTKQCQKFVHKLRFIVRIFAAPCVALYFEEIAKLRFGDSIQVYKKFRILVFNLLA